MPGPPRPSTPVQGRKLTGLEQIQKRATELRLDYSDGMRCLWDGPVETDYFLNTFLPETEEIQVGKENIPTIHFEALKEAENEEMMYKPFVS